MNSKKQVLVELYTETSSMEPLLPEQKRHDLAEVTCEILRKSGELAAQVPAEINRRRIALLVREMNSYYSNLIEGHKTLPRDIERALQKEYVADTEDRANQHLARAHIETETAMLERLKAEPELSVHSEGFLCWLHEEFYRRLPEELHYSESHNGQRFPIHPGKLRTFEVDVHRHQPPAAQALPEFLKRFASFYGSVKIFATNRLVAAGAAHHRLAWIHPFGDGNGRVTRLYSHACLVRCEVDGHGLWTLSRGLARARQDYYAKLAGADRPREHDMDGRGNLSDKGLAEYCDFFLRVMLDQISFMSGLLQLQALGTRMERHLHLERLHLPEQDRARLIRLLRAALVEGEIERGRVHEIVGASVSTGQKVTKLALEEKLMQSDTPKGALSLTFHAETLESYFPKLYQDLPLV